MALSACNAFICTEWPTSGLKVAFDEKVGKK